MKKCFAAVKLTLFQENPGGGCVYDAVALGVPVVLSDIPVNREVDSEHVYFFKAGDAEGLADKMVSVSNLGFDRPSNEELMRRGNLRLASLGDRLMEAVDSVAR